MPEACSPAPGSGPTAEELDAEINQRADKEDVQQAAHAAAHAASAEEQRTDQSAGKQTAKHAAHAAEQAAIRSRRGRAGLLRGAVGLLPHGRRGRSRPAVRRAHGRPSAEGTPAADPGGVSVVRHKGQRHKNKKGTHTGKKSF